MPLPQEGEFTVYPVNGFEERPAFNQGGTDWFGCEWEYSEAAMAASPKPGAYILEDICQWREIVKFPDLENWDWKKAVKLDQLDKADRNTQVVNVMILNGLFERLHALMGFENALCALITDEEEVEAFFDRMTEYKIELITKIAEHYHPDVITFHDDWGTQKGPFFSPDLWRRLIKPRMKKMIEAVHDKNILFIQHSCGKYDELIEDIIEIGVDTLQCMDIMDIGRILQLAGGRMTVQASVHSQEFEALDGAGKLTPELVRNKVREEFRTWGSTGRYYPFLFQPQKWFEKIIMEEYIDVSNLLMGSYKE